MSGETTTRKPSRLLDPQLNAGEAVRIILRQQLDTLEAKEEGTRAGLDPEDLHDFRVAVRRTRSALGQIKKTLPAHALERFRSEFAWLGTVTSPTRDLDVYLLKLPGYRENLPAEIRDDLEPLHRFLLAHRQTARTRLVEELDSARYRQLKEHWRQFLDSPAAGEPPANAQRPLREVADARIRKAFRKALKEGAAISDRSPAEDLHELRKTCKKLRYLLEFFQSLYPEKLVSRLIRALKGLQENLGDFQDLQVQSESLRDFSRQMTEEGQVPPQTLVAMGMLIEGLHQRQQQARQQFAERFAGFASPENRRLFKKLVARSSSARPEPSAKEKTMGGCQKGKSENKPKEGAFQCEKCGAVSKKKDHLCKPEKLSKKDVKKIEGKDKDKKKK